MLARYLRLLNAQPFLTNACTAGCVMAVGDSLAQYLEARQAGLDAFELDRVRSAKMVSWSVLGFVPINYVSYNTIERLLPGAPSSGSRAAPQVLRVVTKAFLATCPATVINPLFFMYSSVLEACADDTRSSVGRASRGSTFY